MEAAINVLMAAIILIVGFFVAGSVSRWVRKMGEASERLDNTLAAFFGSIVKWAILAFVIIAVLLLLRPQGLFSLKLRK